jgi:hypothetical protein
VSGTRFHDGISSRSGSLPPARIPRQASAAT